MRTLLSFSYQLRLGVVLRCYSLSFYTLLRTIYVLYNPSHTIYIIPILYSWMLPIKLMNIQEIVFFLGVIS